MTHALDWPTAVNMISTQSCTATVAEETEAVVERPAILLFYIYY